MQFKPPENIWERKSNQTLLCLTNVKWPVRSLESEDFGVMSGLFFEHVVRHLMYVTPWWLAMKLCGVKLNSYLSEASQGVKKEKYANYNVQV